MTLSAQVGLRFRETMSGHLVDGKTDPDQECGRIRVPAPQILRGRDEDEAHDRGRCAPNRPA